MHKRSNTIFDIKSLSGSTSSTISKGYDIYISSYSRSAVSNLEIDLDDKNRFDRAQ